MALNINGRIKVKTLKSDFKNEFGLNIRVYNGREFADDEATLASIRKGDAVGGEFSPARNTKVGNLEEKMMDMFGLKTQISGSDDSYLCDNNNTLAKALEVDEKLMAKRAKRTDKPQNTPTKEVKNKEMNDKIFLLSVSGSGGEYTCGVIYDEDDVTHLKEREENGELEFENVAEGEYSDYNDVECYNETSCFHLYGFNNSDIEIEISEAEYVDGDYKEINEPSALEVTNSFDLNAPEFIEKDEDNVVLAGVSTEKNINAKYIIKTKGEFEKDNLFMLTVGLEDLVCDSRIITKFYYLPLEKQKTFFKDGAEYFEDMGEDRLAEIMSEYVDEEFENTEEFIDLCVGAFGDFTNEEDLDYLDELGWISDYEVERLEIEGGEGLSREAFLL